MRSATANTIRAVYGRNRDRYLELINRFPLRPIRDDRELDTAMEVIDTLIDCETLTPAEEDYLDVLSDLVEAYEDVTLPMRSVSDADMLRYLISLRGESQTQVSKQSRIAESTISEVLAGKRQLNRAQIGKLAKHFRVEPGTFAFTV